MDVYLPRTLDEALELKAARPETLPLAGGTDVMVEINFDLQRPEAIMDVSRLAELQSWRHENGSVFLGSGLTYTRIMVELGDFRPWFQAARTVGGPQIRNRGTLGGNLGTASPAGDALPPLLVAGCEVELAGVRGARSLPLEEFLLGPKRNALAPDELILGVRVRPARGRQTFMKVGPRNAMVISVVSLALAVDEERGELRAAYGSAGPVPLLVTAPLDGRDGFAEQVAAAARPIDDVRGTAAYRRHALRVLVTRALDRCLA